MHVTKRHDTGWVDSDHITIWVYARPDVKRVTKPTTQTRTVTDYCEKCGMTFGCTVTKRPK